MKHLAIVSAIAVLGLATSSDMLAKGAKQEQRQAEVAQSKA